MAKILPTNGKIKEIEAAADMACFSNKIGTFWRTDFGEIVLYSHHQENLRNLVAQLQSGNLIEKLVYCD